MHQPAPVRTTPPLLAGGKGRTEHDIAGGGAFFGAWLFAVMAVALIAVTSRAQVVRVANFAPVPYEGWLRATVNRLPPARDSERLTTQIVAGYAVTRTDAIARVGRQVGVDTWVVDVHTTLAPFQERAFDLATFSWCVIPRPLLPADVWGHFRGLPRVNGRDMDVVAVLHAGDLTDGAGITGQFRVRVPGTRLLVADLWVTWYPDQPAWCRGEAMVTASNPAVPDLVEVAPEITITWGDAWIAAPGAPAWRLVAAGTRFADGQARAVPLTIAWERFIPPLPGAARDRVTNSQIATALGAVTAVGIDKLLANGNPVYPAGFSPRAWTVARWAESVRVLHTWDAAVCGPAATSGWAGEQEDSAFVRGEALLPGGIGAEVIAYRSALKLANRPCHHREAGGELLAPAMHTLRPLNFHDGRPHSGNSVWPTIDQLGKSERIAQWDVPGEWWGPDVEHAMFATLAAGARLTGSPALQQLLRQQAVQYPLQWTTTPGWSTSQPYAARAVGWEGILAVHLWRELEDRAAAMAVRAHYGQRVAMVLVPQLGTKVRDVWDPRSDVPSLGAGVRWIPWQQALGAYGLDLAGEQFGLPAARSLALRAAKRVLDDAWKQVGGRWVSCASGMLVEPGGTGATFDESFNHYGMPLACAVVLRHEPTHAKSLAVLAQVRASATEPKHTRWIAPGVPQ